MEYSIWVIDFRRSAEFTNYIERLKDAKARSRIATRLLRLASGNAGDVKPVGEGISELRINYGPGYRIYFKRRGSDLILLLCAGDKRSQDEDIALAKKLAKDMEL